MEFPIVGRKYIIQKFRGNVTQQTVTILFNDPIQNLTHYTLEKFNGVHPVTLEDFFDYHEATLVEE